MRHALLGTAFAAALTLSGGANASLIYDATIKAGAQGFGSAPRDLTLQATGKNSTTESGGIGIGAGGTVLFGSTLPNENFVIDPNNVVNPSGTGDMPKPRTVASKKYGAPTAGLLGITQANQIAVLFNATEPGGDSATITDLTLKFYSSDGMLLGAIDGEQTFADTNPGNGVAGFTFVVSNDEQARVNTWLGQGGDGTILTLESTIIDVAGGPESYLIYNLGTRETPPPRDVPEPASLGLLGLGLVGFAAVRRKWARA